MQRLLASVLVLLVGTSLAADTCSASDIQGLTKCYQAFVGGYGFNMTNIIPHYWDVHQVRTAWLDAQGVKIQPKVCQIGNALINCIQRYSCLSQDTYLTLGANTTEAPRWFIDKIATQWQCGAGYSTLISDYYCMAACREHRDAQLNACNTMMKQEIMNGTDPCVATNDMVTCQSKIYATYCDYNAGVFDCGQNVAVIKGTTPMCAPALQDCGKFQYYF
ncbi:unnamed protein product, partial [Mesorhabditis spiculigera]